MTDNGTQGQIVQRRYIESTRATFLCQILCSEIILHAHLSMRVYQTTYMCILKGHQHATNL